jgi:hypothetical protein
VGRGGRASVEDQIAGKEHAGAAVEDHQVGFGVAVQGDQLKAVIAHRQRAGGKLAGRGDGSVPAIQSPARRYMFSLKLPPSLWMPLMVAGRAARVSGRRPGCRGSGPGGDGC